MLYMIRELIKRTYNYFPYTSFCYGRELLSSKFFVKLETTTTTKLTKQMMLVARTQKQKSQGKWKPSEERKKKKEGIIIPTMRNPIRGYPEFSTEQISSSNVQNLPIDETPNKWIISPLNKSWIYQRNRVRLDYISNILSSRLD